jgi:hypothetical protein
MLVEFKQRQSLKTKRGGKRIHDETRELGKMRQLCMLRL